MATPAATDKDGSFFELGEVRLATDSDFDYFAHLAKNFDGWVKKYDKHGVTVWNKDTGGKTVKMLKVRQWGLYCTVNILRTLLRRI